MGSLVESSRLFFALWPDESTRARVADLGERFHRDYGGRRVARDSLHITLAFLGNTLNSRLTHLQALGGRINTPTFTLTLTHAGAWRGGVFWLAPSENPPALTELVSSLHHELKAEMFSFDDKRFTPHMTLLRNVKPFLGEIIVAPITFAAEDFVLARTIPLASGVRHEVMNRFPLR